jgi:hypothetical protein
MKLLFYFFRTKETQKPITPAGKTVVVTLSVVVVVWVWISFSVTVVETRIVTVFSPLPSLLLSAGFATTPPTFVGEGAAVTLTNVVA